MKTNIEMAREAGFKVIDNMIFVDWWEINPYMQRFAELVRADEREALIHYFNEHWRSDWSDGQIIEAIEARKNT